MPKKIGVLFKVFSKKKFKDDFLDGSLYMNTIDYFRKYEEDLEDNIADRFEALSWWLQPNDAIIELECNGEKITLSHKDLAAPSTLRRYKYDCANIYCMTHLHSRDIDTSCVKSGQEEKLLESYFILPPEIENLGKYLVMIFEPVSFLDRVKEKSFELAEEIGLKTFMAGQVTYYDEKNSSLVLDDDFDSVFHKQSKFSHQSEFRLCLIRDNPENERIVLNIGSIRDIAIEMETKDFNRIIKLSRG